MPERSPVSSSRRSGSCWRGEQKNSYHCNRGARTSCHPAKKGLRGSKKREARREGEKKFYFGLYRERARRTRRYQISEMGGPVTSRWKTPPGGTERRKRGFIRPRPEKMYAVGRKGEAGSNAEQESSRETKGLFPRPPPTRKKRKRPMSPKVKERGPSRPPSRQHRDGPPRSEKKSPPPTRSETAPPPERKKKEEAQISITNKTLPPTAEGVCRLTERGNSSPIL